MEVDTFWKEFAVTLIILIFFENVVSRFNRNKIYNLNLNDSNSPAYFIKNQPRIL